MLSADKENKEVRLFGEKSIREEAYHKKILQLEKEIANLETLAKEHDEHGDDIKPKSQPKNLNNLYYESLFAFEKKIKKEHEFLEKRASEITERFDLQAQRLIMSIETSFRKKVKWASFVILVLALPPVLFIGYANIKFISTRIDTTRTTSISSKISYIRTALQTQTKYRHQYEISNINVLDGSYIIEVQLSSLPNKKWYLKDMSQDIIKVFQRYSGYAPAEISFVNQGKLYAKVDLSGTSKKPFLQYFY